ncbi:MAG TPA: hypothetical protein VNZ45_07660, partial [Bacteroidia bacterium]|nr:hypothetical protein [Bacteroidia bacterium]
MATFNAASRFFKQAFSIAFILLVFGVGKVQACAYTVSGTESTPALILSGCSSNNFIYTLTNNGSSIPGPVAVQINLPLGISFNSPVISFSSSDNQASYSCTTLTGDPSPVLNVSNWNAGQTITVTISVQVPCATNNTAPTLTSVTVGGCAVSPFTPQSLSIQTAILEVDNVVVTGSYIQNIGDYSEIVYKLQNKSSNANIPNISIACTPDQTTHYDVVSGNNIYYLSSTGSPALTYNEYTYSVPAQNYPNYSGILNMAVGNTINIGASDFQNFFGNANTTLQPGQIIYVHIPFNVYQCYKNPVGSYTFTWGCGLTNCSSQMLTTSINVEEGNPVLAITYSSPFNTETFCTSASPNNSGTISVTYTNKGTDNPSGEVGNGRAVKIKLYIGDATPSLGSIDPTSFVLSNPGYPSINIYASFPSAIIPVGTLYEIDLSQIAVQSGNWAPLGPNSLADLDGDGDIDDLTTTGQFTISFTYTYNSNPASCPAFSQCSSSNYMVLANFISKYNSECLDIDPSDNRVNNNLAIFPDQRYYYNESSIPSTLGLPPDVVAGQDFNADICAKYGQQWSPVGVDFLCPHGYHNIHVVLPPGIHLNAVTPPLTSDGNGGFYLPAITVTTNCGYPPTMVIAQPDAKETPASGCTPGYIDINLGRIPVANCISVSQTYNLPCFNLPLVENCDGGVCGTNFGYDNMTYTLDYVCDPGCINCTDELTCAPGSTYHHCSGLCPGIPPYTSNSFQFKRTNLGTSDPNTTTYPNNTAYYDCTSTQTPLQTQTPINTAAAYPGDQIDANVSGGLTAGIPNTFSDMELQIQYAALPAGSSGSADLFDFDPSLPTRITIAGASSGISFINGTWTIPAGAFVSVIGVSPSPNNMNISIYKVLQSVLTSGDYNTFLADANPETLTFVTDLRLRVKATNSSPHAPGTSTFLELGTYPLHELRTLYYCINASNSDSVKSCDPWGTEFSLIQPLESVGCEPGTSTCGQYTANFYFESDGGEWGANLDDFPAEFRPYAALDAGLIVTTPPGY